MKEEFKLVRLAGRKKIIGRTLAQVLPDWHADNERFLFVGAHDDDLVVGAGLLMQLAKRENVPVFILIATDGSMGYCSLEEKDSISEIRRRETFECYHSLGVPEENILWLGFPDCQMNNFRGRRPAIENDRGVIAGFTGTQNSFTYYLRKIKPSRCFVVSSADLHPDHLIVNEELLISLFHSTGSIWPELGAPLDETPLIYELANYCNFPGPPQLQINTPISLLDKKISAIEAYRSQRQIEATAGIVKRGGPVEYIRELQFKLYTPSDYDHLFE